MPWVGSRTACTGKGCAHTVRKLCREIPCFGRGDRDKGKKMQKTAENVTPGYHDCKPPHNTTMLQLKEKWFKAATGSAMGISWSSDNIWGDSRCCKEHLQAGTGYDVAPSHRWFWALACLDLDPFSFQGMSAPTAGTTSLHPPPLLLGISSQNGGSGKALLEVLLGFRSPALTRFAHLLLVKNEIIPFSCQRLKIKMSQI